MGRSSHDSNILHPYILSLPEARISLRLKVQEYTSYAEALLFEIKNHLNKLVIISESVYLHHVYEKNVCKNYFLLRINFINF